MRSFIFRLFLLLGLLFPAIVSAADTWVTKASMLTPRFNAAAAVVNGKLYVIGGKDAANAAMATTEEYDPANNTWVTKAPMPTARWNFALAVVNGKLYAIGGKSGGGTAAVAGMNNNEEYDPVANTWAAKAPMPTGRNGRGAGVINGKIYVVGGRIGPNSAPVFTPINEEYNPATNTWASKAPMPAPRANLAAAVINNKLYAVGGWNGTALSPSVNKNEEYDPSTDTWVAKAPMMSPREDIAAAVVNNKLYAIGGFFANGTGSLLETNSNEEYDPASNSWLSRSPMPTARGTATAAVVNNLVYAVGGSNAIYSNAGNTSVAGSILYATNEEYTPPAPGAVTQTNTNIQAGLTTLQNLFATSIPAANNATLAGLFDPNFFSDGMNRTAFITMLTDPVDGPGVGFQFTNFAEIAAPAGAVANDATHQWFTFTPIVKNALQQPEVWLAIKDGAGNWLSLGNQQKYGVYSGTGSDWGVNPASHWLNISIDDPNSTIQSAVLSGGTGLGSGALSSMNNTGGGKRWSSFFDATNTSAGTFNYNSFPTLPVTYTLTITDKNGTVWSKPITYSGFNTNSVSNVTPTGNYTGTTAPTFSWTAPPGGSYNYSFQLAEIPRTSTSFFWSNHNLGAATSVSYTGTAQLPSCSQISVFAEDANGNASAVNTYLGNNLPAGQSCGPNGVTATGTGTIPVAGTNFDQMFIGRNLSLPNTTENFGVSLRFPRAANDTLSSYSIACPGVPTVNGTFATASQAGTEWVTPVNFSTQPATPFDCTSTVTYANGATTVATATVDRFIAPNAYISGLSVTPNQNVTTLQTVSWTPTTATPTVGSYTHQGNVFSSGPNNSFGSQLWFFGYQTAQTVTYTGPALTANNAYYIAVSTMEGAGTNKMYAAQTFVPFCYQCTASAPMSSTVDVVGSYLHTDASDQPNTPTVVNLAQAGYAPGDSLSIHFSGSMSYSCSVSPQSDQLQVSGLFSTSNTVLSSSLLNRVSGSISVGGFNSFSSVNALGSNDPTDIPEDFSIPPAGVWADFKITIPAGANYLFLAMGDSHYKDNCGTVSVDIAKIAPNTPSAQTQSIGTISFSPTTLAAGGTTTVSATATSSLAVSFSSTTPSICTVSGSAVTGVAAGACTIAANQAGNATYAAAAQVTQSITVGSTTPTGGTNFDQIVIGRNLSLPNTTENFGVSLRFPRAANDTLSSYSIACPGVPTVNGTFATASQAGTEWVTPVNFSTQPATPFDCTSTVTYANGTTHAATATVDRFIAANAYISGLSVTPNQNVTTLQTVSWTPTTATPTVGSYTHLGNVFSAGPNNSLGSQLWVSGYQTASTVTYAGPALAAGNSYHLNVATMEGVGTNKMYAAQTFVPFCYQCTATQPVVATKGTQTITLINFGSAGTTSLPVGGTATLRANVDTVVSSAGVGVGMPQNPATFASTTLGICTVTGTTVTGVAAGTCTITANMAGNDYYNAASQVTQSITIGSALPAGTALNLVASWNLLGHSVNAPLTVATAFSNANQVATVWKWIPATSKWAFYTPSMDATALAAYAAGKGYDVLTTIYGGEGFWVNAKTAFTVQLPAGTAISP